MILHALKEYYDRKAADAESSIAPLGWEKKEIPFLVVIDEDGNFLRFEDTREPDGKKLRAKSFVVPSLGEAKGNGIKSNLFWENAEYMFGIPMRDGSKPKRVAEQHNAFKSKIFSLSIEQNPSNALMAVRAFTENFDRETIQADSLWTEVQKLNQPLLLCLNRRGVVTNLSEIRDVVNQAYIASQKDDEVLCLVSGKPHTMAKLEPPVRGVQGASTMGAHLVSVNNKVTESGNGGATPAFASFMKEQGANSPIGKPASLAYTTALNALLGKDSPQKIQVGDATTVFWAARSNDLENQVSDIFGDPFKDNPDRRSDAVKSLYRSTETGAFVTDTDDTRFYVLGLSPNNARLAIRFWHTGTVAEMAGRFRAHFDAIDICHGPNEPKYLSLWRLLVSIAQQGKSGNIPPHIAGDTMRAILEGLPYPASLFQAAIIRVKAERAVSYPRAALIKAYLNRILNKEEILVSLDLENTNIGYRLGRLFAALERIQEVAHPGIKATIRDRFYAAASSTPVTVFNTLLRMKIYHIAKLEHPGYRVKYEKLLGEIFSSIPVSGFPAHLSLEDQGRFAIGYYHQRQSFFIKNATQQGE